MPFEVRRFVAGHNEQGKSNITFDDTASNVPPITGWPVDNRGTVDRGDVPCVIAAVLVDAKIAA